MGKLFLRQFLGFEAAVTHIFSGVSHISFRETHDFPRFSHCLVCVSFHVIFPVIFAEMVFPPPAGRCGTVNPEKPRILPLFGLFNVENPPRQERGQSFPHLRLPGMWETCTFPTFLCQIHAVGFFRLFPMRVFVCFLWETSGFPTFSRPETSLFPPARQAREPKGRIKSRADGRSWSARKTGKKPCSDLSGSYCSSRAGTAKKRQKNRQKNARTAPFSGNFLLQFFPFSVRIIVYFFLLRLAERR